MYKKYISLVLISLTVASIFTISGEATALANSEDPAAPSRDYPFSDVGPNSFYFLPLNYLQTRDIVKGYDDGTFKPDEKINRAEALKMIFLGTGIQIDQNNTSIGTKLFGDTESDIWYNPYLKYAVDNQIINGYEDKTFKPSSNISLVEALKILSMTRSDIAYPDTTDTILKFDDVNWSEWYGKYLMYAVQNNQIRKTKDTKLYPNNPVSRGQLADFLYRFKSSQETGRPYAYNGMGKASYYGDAFDGKGTSSGDRFDKSAYSAAHIYMPLGTFARISNQGDVEKSVMVKINDRGGFGALGREIDLSEASFAALNPLSKGVAQVEVHEEIFRPDISKTLYNLHQILPDLIPNDIFIPSIFQEGEIFSFSLSVTSPTNLSLSSPAGTDILNSPLTDGKTYKIDFLASELGTYNLKIGDITSPLYVIPRLDGNFRNSLPDISTNNYHLTFTGSGSEMYQFSWDENKLNPDSIYSLAFRDNERVLFYVTARGTNLLKVPKSSLPRDIFGKDLFMVLSERDKFTEFSIDYGGDWQPVSKATLHLE